MVLHFFLSLFGVLLFLLPLFLAAGTYAYPEGLMFAFISVCGVILNTVLVSSSAAVHAERMHGVQKAEAWDARVLMLSALCTIFAYSSAGLDSGRLHFSPEAPWYLTVCGCVCVIAGTVMFAVAKYQNEFFSSGVRIQHERGHHVCDTGLYAWIRHPGYAGMILSWVGFPLVLGSLISVPFVVVCIALLLYRTVREDMFLHQHLSGYSGYAKKVPHRLVPGVW